MKLKDAILKEIAGIAGMWHGKTGLFGLHAGNMPAMEICWHEKSSQNGLKTQVLTLSCHHARHASKISFFCGFKRAIWGGYTAQKAAIRHAVYPHTRPQ